MTENFSFSYEQYRIRTKKALIVLNVPFPVRDLRKDRKTFKEILARIEDRDFFFEDKKGICYLFFKYFRYDYLPFNGKGFFNVSVMDYSFPFDIFHTEEALNALAFVLN